MQSASIRNFNPDELASLFDLKYRGSTELGPDPARQRRFNYYNPDDHYEALIRKLVQPQTRWLEVGCGRHIFPSNPALAKELSARCALLTGVDPDETCPSSKQMGLLSVFHKGGSGSSLFDVKPLGFDGSSGGFGWSVF